MEDSSTAFDLAESLVLRAEGTAVLTPEGFDMDDPGSMPIHFEAEN